MRPYTIPRPERLDLVEIRPGRPAMIIRRPAQGPRPKPPKTS